MDALLRLLLTNAALSGLLALTAWTASRFVRRQAVVHGLWLLALVKLVTPPLVDLPLPPLGSKVVEAPQRPPAARTEVHPLAARGPVTTSPVTAQVAAAEAAEWRVPSRPGRPANCGASPLARPAAVEADSRPVSSPSLESVVSAGRRALPVFLAVGALVVAGLTAYRFVRFRSLLSRAEPAPPALASRATELAARVGVTRVPPLLLVAAHVPPLLWPSSTGPNLLLPRDLLPALGAGELDALLAHELAHVRRRDHWVRFLEVGATALFWWYPVTWWARRALRRAEERCCDEWVLRALPDSARAYADGILKSLTFLSDVPMALPATASGAGPIEDLESRLKEILMTNPRPRLSRPTRFALGALAIGALALFPTLAPPRSAEAAAVAVPQDVERPARPAPAAPPVALARPHAPAPLAPPSRVAVAGVPGRPAPPPLAQNANPGAGPDDEPDPALEAERRALDDQRRQLHLAQIDLERKAMELQARMESQARAAEIARLRADGDAAGVAWAEKRGALATRRTDLERRQLELQVQQARLEAEVENADAAGPGEKGSEATRQEAEKAERELEKKQQVLETEEEKLDRELRALDAEERVHELREATDDLARSLAEQIASLRETLPEVGAHKGELEREIERLEVAFGALKGAAPRARAPRSAGPPTK